MEEMGGIEENFSVSTNTKNGRGETRRIAIRHFSSSFLTCECRKMQTFFRTEPIRHLRRKQREAETTFPSRKIRSLPVGNFTEPGQVDCLRPEYIVFTWILCLIAVTSALKLYYFVKTFLATVIVLVYAVLIFVVSDDLFSANDDDKDE